MKYALFTFTVLILAGQTALSADVFVRQARGANLDSTQAQQVTEQVKKAVRNMPEHNLVTSEAQSDFVLEPSLVTRANSTVLRIEKTRDGQTIAMAEEPVDAAAAQSLNAVAATETAMQEDQYVDGGTSSAASVAATEDTGLSIGAERDIASSPTTDASPSRNANEDTVSGTTESAGAMDELAARDSGPAAADVRAPSPRFTNPDRLGYFQAGFGPAFPLGMESDRVMYDINAAYNIDLSANLSAKAFGDINLSTGGDTARFINFGLGAEIYPGAQQIAGGRPYLMGDVGYAFTRRNETNEQRDGVAVGAGAGFKFAAAALNMDVNAHYTILTSQMGGTNPSVLGLRFALNF